MRPVAVLAAAAALVAQHANAQSGPIVNTPAALVVCQPAAITFSGGQAPYFLSVLPAGQVSATPLENLPDQSAAGTYTWTVNLPAGTNITLSIRDGAGTVNYAAPVVIQSGTSTSCIGSTPTSAAAGTTAAPTTTGSSLVTTATSASVTVTAASGLPTPPASNVTGPVNATAPGAYNFTCSPGQGDLTYGITVATLQNVTLSQLTAYFSNWTGVAPGRLINATGTGVGANRTYAVNNVTIAETLRLNQTNTTTGSLHQQWNFTRAGAVTLAPNLTIYNAFEDLTVYTNTTTNASAIQFFILACFNNQTTGLTAIASLVEQSFAYWAAQISGSGRNASTPAVRVRRAVQLF